MSPFPTIPADSVPCFVSDTKSLTVHPGNPWLWNPGTLNQGGQINENNRRVELYILEAEGYVQAMSSFPGLLAWDLDFELYDIGGPTPVPTGQQFHFTAPFGNAANGKTLNGSSQPGLPMVSRMPLCMEAPVKLFTQTPLSGGPFQVGPRWLFFSGITSPLITHVCYRVRGAWHTP